MITEKNLSILKQIANQIYDLLGSGFDECVYQNAFTASLRRNKIEYEEQKVVEIKYLGICVGEAYIDILAHFFDERVLLELKAIGKIGEPEINQLRTYMRLLGMHIGVLINFSQPGRSATGRIKNKPQMHLSELEFLVIPNDNRII